MRGRVALVLLGGCVGSQIAIRVGDVDVRDDRMYGRCDPTTHVTVTDTSGAPVQGALVSVRQQDHLTCPSAGPSAPLYTTDPVATDSRGVATTCDPDTFFPQRSSICPHHRDPPTIVVLAGDRGAVLAPPFTGELHAVLVSCAELRARDPEFPCP